MPTMASITVKKADGTTDIVYDAISASGGDSSPAVWRQDTGAAAGLPVGLRSIFKLQTQFNSAKTARQLKFNFVAPYATLNSTTGVYSAADRLLLDGYLTLPQNMPASALVEAAQGFNLLASALVKAAAAAGYAPT